MNNHTQRLIAASGLEMLKEAVLLVLYEQYSDESRQFAKLGEIRESLNLPRGRSGQNHLIRGVLEILEVRGYVEPNYSSDAAWQITENGILLIES
ncbi:MAG: hypothetical protein OXU36_08915 [Candidatus Poribacteria bacterium]|nr:hypothetical protein [Candidatus Poribacteria bacterium]